MHALRCPRHGPFASAGPENPTHLSEDCGNEPRWFIRVFSKCSCVVHSGREGAINDYTRGICIPLFPTSENSGASHLAPRTEEFLGISLCTSGRVNVSPAGTVRSMHAHNHGAASARRLSGAAGTRAPARAAWPLARPPYALLPLGQPIRRIHAHMVLGASARSLIAPRFVSLSSIIVHSARHERRCKCESPLAQREPYLHNVRVG